MLKYNLVRRCVCERKCIAYTMNAKKSDEKKYYQTVYTNFPFGRDKKQIYLYNNTTTTFRVAYVSDADHPLENTIKLQTTYVLQEPQYITTLRFGEYLKITKMRANKYSQFVDHISEGEYEVREEKKIKGDAFYYIHINEFLEQEDDRTNIIIKTL